MESFKRDFLGSCSEFSNVRIVCSDGCVDTHKLLLAVSGNFIKFLLEDVEDSGDVTLIMTEFKTGDIEEYLDQVLFQTLSPSLSPGISVVEKIFRSKPPESLIRPNLKLKRRDSQTEERQWDSSNEDEDSQEAMMYDSEIDNKLMVKMEHEEQDEKDSKPRAKKKFLTPVKSSYPARSVVNIEELSKQLIANPLTPAQVKKNEWVEKQIRHEKAVLAYLGGEDSMREISVKYNVKKSTLSRLLQSDRTIDRTGRRTSIFTAQEETTIANKARAWVNQGGSLTINMLRDMMYEEIRTLKLIHPDRQFCSLSSKDGEAIHRSYVRRFVIRNDLERLLFRKFTLLDKRKFECDICSKSFTLKCSLVTHQKQIHYSFLNKIPT